MAEYSYIPTYPAQADESLTVIQYPTIPQYTHSQLSAYFAQYQCLPAQPYQIVADYSPHPHEPWILQPATDLAQPSQSGHPSASSSSSGIPTKIPALDIRNEQWENSPPTTNQGEATVGRALQPLPEKSTDLPIRRSSSKSKTWTCAVPHCTSNARFTRLADLQRHEYSVHGMGTPEYPCQIPHCLRVGDKGFTRKDHLFEHLRNFHKIDVPKRRAGERSAFPMGWTEVGLR